jgi:cell division protease FtsH
MWHHFKKAPVFVSIDNYKNFDAYLPADETMENLFTKRDLEKKIGIIMGGMVAEDEVCGNDSKTVGASHDLMEATAIARRMVVEYGFGEAIKNTSLIALQDFALTSGKEIFDDVQKILDNVKTETEGFISKNKELLNRLVKKLEDNVLMNGDAIARFFDENPLN